MVGSSQHRRWTSFALVAGAVALAAAGCAKKEATPAAQAAANDIVVTAQDYAFTAPDSISAGLEMFRLANKGPALHHLQIVELLEGKTLGDLMSALQNPGPPPAWIRWVGGPNAIPPVPTDTAVAWLTLTPGNYAMLCVIPDSAGVPHFAHGMVRALTVTPSAATPAPEPQADVVIHLKDYEFDIIGNLTPGQHIVRVVNDGPQVHEMLVGQLAPGKSAQDLVTWVDTGHMRGAPPARPIGGTTGIAPGGEEEISLDLTPGNYGLWCFFPDSKDGKEHVMHGMIKQFTVS
jgi:uncharacterized cupredoxin-like copper-binding protein